MIEIQCFHEYVESIRENTLGFISAAVVNTLDGQIISFTSSSPYIDNSLAACFQTQVLSEFEKSFEFIDALEEKRVDHAIVFVENQMHLIYTMLNRSFISHIILDREKSNLALAEYTHNKYHTELEAKLIKAIGGAEAAKHHPLFNEVMFLD